VKYMPRDKDYAEVIKVLRSHRAMPFLELTALTSVGDSRVREIVRDLEQHNWVKVRNEEDETREIIIARAPAFELTI